MRFDGSAVCALMLGFLLSAPAWSEPDKTESAAGGNPQTQGKSSSANSSSSVPAKALGFLSGCIVGIPVCAVRNTISDEKYTIKQWTGDSNKKALTIPAAVVWFPFAVFSGVGASPLSAIKHSGQNFSKPFSKEQFSLGEDQWEPTPAQ